MGLGKKSLSLAMIVKDEENCIKRCLDSVINFVDEIVIVDTGSTDRTIEICHSYNAQVFAYTGSSGRQIRRHPDSKPALSGHLVDCFDCTILI